jgi:hypothetical protein
MSSEPHALVASEHVVLDEPEAFRAKTIEPGLNIALRPRMSRVTLYGPGTCQITCTCQPLRLGLQH